MPIYARVAAVWQEVKDAYIKQAGAWVPLNEIHVRDAAAWKLVFASEVTATVSSAVNNLNIQTLFSAADWANPLKKKIVNINADVSSTNTTAALLTGTGRGGPLVINNNAWITGRSGPGGGANSGAGQAGGPAINVQQTGVTINNSNHILGGGGGGGGGGAGGGGYVPEVIGREPATGDAFNRWQPFTWLQTGAGGLNSNAHWYGTQIKSGPPADINSFAHGGYTYYKGSHRDNAGGTPLWGLYRTWLAQGAYNTNGGNGGAGGVGQGTGVARAAGAAGVNGGANAGRGGNGGTGGFWGDPGANGAAGATGNRTGGAAGGAGGAGGAAIMGSTRTLNNTGVILGAH